METGSCSTTPESSATSFDGIRAYLEWETRGLLTRIEAIPPLVEQETPAPGARISPRAQLAIERYLSRRLEGVHRTVTGLLVGIKSADIARVSPDAWQRSLTHLRLRLGGALHQFDIFSDVLTQRSERDVGPLLAGLDHLASDALRLPRILAPPSVVCFLDRGLGAAIRRTGTRLPGGGRNPVAIVRIPRERLIGSAGIGSSVSHECGHQAAACLGLVTSLRRAMPQGSGSSRRAWDLFRQWASEILADFWAVSHMGAAATRGLASVVSLPRGVVFALGGPSEVHPIPFHRVLMSCTMGAELYADEAFAQLRGVWDSLYPSDSADRQTRDLLRILDGETPALARLVAEHRPPSLGGASLREALPVEDRRPDLLARHMWTARRDEEHLRSLKPTLALAVVGRAYMRGEITPEEDSITVTSLLQTWALRRLDGGSQSNYGRTPPRPAGAVTSSHTK